MSYRISYHCPIYSVETDINFKLVNHTRKPDIKQNCYLRYDKLIR